jgi:hypothetical protein
VREHFAGGLGSVRLDRLKAALTAFPRAPSVKTYLSPAGNWGAGPDVALVEWLLGGGHGASLTTVTSHTRSDLERTSVLTALAGGALPSLRGVALDLAVATHRASLTEGRLRGMHELRLRVDGERHELQAQLASLGLVRQLPALAKLEVEARGVWVDPVPQWPPFIPPFLKALTIYATHCTRFSRSLLRALPRMIGAGGAAMIERLEVEFPSDFRKVGLGLVTLARALRGCAATLKGFRISTDEGYFYVGCGIHEDEDDDDDAEEQLERLRWHWAVLLAGLSACRELEVLILPPYMEVQPAFPPGATFARLSHLQISASKPEEPPDVGLVGLWEVMASGGLPALAKLRVEIRGHPEVTEEVKTRVAPAFEAVAGTLTHLCLTLHQADAISVGMGYELGVAVGKLRRLKDLALALDDDGRAYHAFAQGLAASGGESPLPLLWRVGVVVEVDDHAGLLPGLLLPSVRVFGSAHGTSHAALLTACALRQAGYKHIWAMHCLEGAQDGCRAIAQCKLGQRNVDELFDDLACLPSCD